MIKYTATSVVTLLALVALPSCQTKNVTVGVENARFQHGYLNSKLLSQGTLLLWDMDAANDKKLTKEPGPNTSNNDTVRDAGGTELTSKATSGLAVSGEIPIQQISVEAKAEIARQTSIVVKDFASRRFYDPTFVLNQPNFAQKRVELGRMHSDNEKIRFIFIAGATVANDTDISIGTPTGKENEFKLTVAGKEYKLTYSGTKTYQWKGSQEPIFVQPRIYKIVKDSNGETGYRFEEDRRISVDLPEMLTDASTF
jgi:hypothetical protein